MSELVYTAYAFVITQSSEGWDAALSVLGTAAVKREPENTIRFFGVVSSLPDVGTDKSGKRPYG